jgi:hypothetical protein
VAGSCTRAQEVVASFRIISQFVDTLKRTKRFLPALNAALIEKSSERRNAECQPNLCNEVDFVPNECIETMLDSDIHCLPEMSGIFKIQKRKERCNY